MAKSSKAIPDKVQPLIEEFDVLRLALEEYKSSMCQTLESILQNSTLQHHSITSRVKEAESLRKKLSQKRFHNIKSVKEVNDLVGCRVTFYTDQEAQDFTRLLYDQFKVFNVNPHKDPKGYNGINLTIGYDKIRLKLPEYIKYADLKCEVQITTVLYHAWNEIAHDSIYKPLIDQAKFPDKMKVLDKRMKLAAGKLIKLQTEFDYIKKLSKQLNKIEPLYKQQYLDSILNSKNTGIAHENIKALHEVVEQFGHRFDKDIALSEYFLKLHNSVPLKKIVPKQNVFGETHDITHEQLILDILQILKLGGFRYNAINASIELGIRYFSSSEEPLRKAAEELIDSVVKYNYNLLKQVGFFAQLEAIKSVGNLSDDELIENKAAVAKIISNIAQPTFERHEMKDPITFSFGTGHLSGNENHMRVRADAFAILERLFELNETGFNDLFTAAQDFTQLPHQGEVSEDLIKVVKQDTEKVFALYLKYVNDMSLHDLKDLDEQLQYLERRFKGDSIEGVVKVRQYLEGNKNYIFFRMLVGYDMRHSVDTDWREADKLRDEYTDSVVSEMTTRNYKRWERKIIEVAETYNENENIQEYEDLGKLLYKISKKKPDLGKKLFEKNKNVLRFFFINFLIGLSDNGTVDDYLKTTFEEYSKQRDYLRQCIIYCQQVKRSVSVSEFRDLFEISKQHQDSWALALLLGAMTKKYLNGSKFKSLYLEIIDYLTNKQNTDWLSRVYFQDLNIFEDMSIDEYQRILDNLVYAERIDYHIETILKPLIKKNQTKIIEFLLERIKRESIIKKDNRSTEYDATPYQFYDLNKNGQFVTVENIEYLSSKVGEFNSWGRFQLSSFVNSILKDAQIATIEGMADYLQSASKTTVKMIADALWNIDSQDVKLSIIYNFLINPNSKGVRSSFSSAIFSTGMVSGKYGIANAHKEIIQKLQPWVNDDNPTVVKFAKKEIRNLNKQIADEIRRSDQRDDHMKFDFMY